MKNFLHFICAVHLFCTGTTRPKVLSSMLKIREVQILDWAIAWYWKPATWLLGHRGDIIMRGLEKHRARRCEYRTNVKRFHANRMRKLKSEMLRQYGALTNDLATAEKKWTKLFSSASGRKNEVSHD